MPVAANPLRRDFYVYTFHVEGYPFYVGIGRDRRASDRLRYIRSLTPAKLKGKSLSYDRPKSLHVVDIAVLTLDHGTIASTDIRLRLMPSDKIDRGRDRTRPSGQGQGAGRPYSAPERRATGPPGHLAPAHRVATRQSPALARIASSRPTRQQRQHHNAGQATDSGRHRVITATWCGPNTGPLLSIFTIEISAKAGLKFLRFEL